MDNRNLRVLFLIAWVGLAVAGIISLLSALFTRTGSIVSSLIGLGLSLVFYLLWKDAKDRA